MNPSAVNPSAVNPSAVNPSAVNPSGRRTLAAGALLGLLGVAMGAFGAHGLRDSVSTRDLEIWQTGAHYQQLHAAVLVALGLLGRPARALSVAATLLVVGVVIFSGTLYAMVLGGPRILGAITPLGGLCLMTGWAAIALYALVPGPGSSPGASS